MPRRSSYIHRLSAGAERLSFTFAALAPAPVYAW